MIRITIPARINGTLTVRECSPVLMDPRAWDERESATVEERVVLFIVSTGCNVILNNPDGPDDSCHVEHLSLRLDDETGRFHALRWLQKHDPAGAALVAMWRQIRRRGQLPDYLSALDLDDESLLEDGSTRVAALVLQAVCLHVGGQQ